MKINWLNLIAWLLLLMISIVSIAILIRFWILVPGLVLLIFLILRKEIKNE